MRQKKLTSLNLKRFKIANLNQLSIIYGGETAGCGTDTGTKTNSNILDTCPLPPPPPETEKDCTILKSRDCN